MSRYTKRVGNKVFAYGFDRPLQTYFFQRFDDPVSDDSVDDVNVVFDIGSDPLATLCPHPDNPDKMGYSNSELLEVVKKEMAEHAPEDFCIALALDLPL